jgi:hypothetical protein
MAGDPPAGFGSGLPPNYFAKIQIFNGILVMADKPISAGLLIRLYRNLYFMLK